MIRAVEKGDREAVRRLWAALMDAQASIDDRFSPSDDAEERWKNDFDQWLQAESRRMFVALEGDRVCGFITAERWAPPPIYRDRPAVYVDELFVESDCRREGHGTDLVLAVRRWGERIGARELRAGVLAGNDEATAFWKELGGVEISKSFAIELNGEGRDGKIGTGSEGRIGFSL
ncbi:MAG: GNAT family N-acetyltransferase [Rhodothermales bacterium]